MGFWERLMGEEPSLLQQWLNYDDKGSFGEYLIKYALTNIPGYQKVLRNIYVPYDGKTSEIDVLLIHEKGIFVFESKNYSGWIFGGLQNAQLENIDNKIKKQTKERTSSISSDIEEVENKSTGNSSIE